MRPVVCWSVCLAIALAGCVDEAPPPQATPDRAEDEGTLVPETNGTASGPAAPLDEVVTIHWNGTLGTLLFVCEGQLTNGCHGQEVRDHDNSVYVERPGATLRALTMTLTWEATSPANERLALGAMVMGLCDDCESTRFDSVEGRSPLTIDLSGLDVPVPPEHVVHIFAHNAEGIVHQPPHVVFWSLEQPIGMDGSLTFEHPA